MKREQKKKKTETKKTFLQIYVNDNHVRIITNKKKADWGSKEEEKKEVPGSHLGNTMHYHENQVPHPSHLLKYAAFVISFFGGVRSCGWNEKLHVFFSICINLIVS